MCQVLQHGKLNENKSDFFYLQILTAVSFFPPQSHSAKQGLNWHQSNDRPDRRAAAPQTSLLSKQSIPVLEGKWQSLLDWRGSLGLPSSHRFLLSSAFPLPSCAWCWIIHNGRFFIFVWLCSLFKKKKKKVKEMQQTFKAKQAFSLVF